MRHFLSFNDFTKDEILEIIELAKKIKAEFHNGVQIPYLDKKILGMIFEKSSTRTRVSFESGIYQLGGHGMFLSSRDIQLGRGEPIKDTSKVISSMVDMIMLRTFEHEKLEELAKYSSVPVINGLTDLCHPVQILADYLTILEEGIEKPVISYIGDGNNMANSFILFSTKMGIKLQIATPKGYEPNNSILQQAEKLGGDISLSNSPEQAIAGANVVVTDTWISMGMEEEKETRIKDFEGFKIDKELFSQSEKDAIFLHCLPAYRGYEVADEVIDGKHSRIYQEAENRLHAQKGLMVWLNNHYKK